MSFTVGQVSRMAGITVRTLHHYDEVGLLSPSGRSRAGYRQYGADDLERLQQILCYRELGFSLDDITAIVSDGQRTAIDHLARQRALLTERIARLQAIVTAVDTMMEAHQMGISLNPEDMLEVFGDHDPTQYADEVQQRWGDTDAYRESHRRTSQYTKADWLQVKQESQQIEQRFVAALQAGLPADSTEAMDVAEAARRQIDQRFYSCTHDMHRGLADLYVADPRFTAHYDDQAPGLAQYVHDAIHANADRAATNSNT
jgi:MerR family transcriptional regulator, thiopeptide resistance regulator